MMRTRTVLHIIDSLGLGGAQTLVKGLLESNTTSRNFLYVLRRRSITVPIRHPNVNTYHSSSKWSFIPLFELYRLIVDNEIDIVHCHLFRSQSFGWILKLLFPRRIKLVFHEHGEIFENGFFYRTFMKISKRHVDSYIAISEATKRKLMEFSGISEKKINVLYNFVDLKRFFVSKSLSAEKRLFTVGFGARLIQRKGWSVFLAAAHYLRDMGYRFIIVGDGPDKESVLQEIKQCSLDSFVTYEGYIANMSDFYSRIDCFVIPSLWEPMGLTELEAQASGVPVIASDVEGLNEVIQDGVSGLLFQAGQAADLASKIEQIHSDEPLRATLTKQGLENAKKYDVSVYVKALSSVYDALDQA